MKYDVFISHASEDKRLVVNPLARYLKEFGLNVWLDKFELKLGDSLRRSIDRGLAESRFGIVIISPSFICKEWPKRELDALFSRDDSEGSIILPVWHKVNKKVVEKFSALLVDKLAASTDDGIKNVAARIFQVVVQNSGIEGIPAATEANGGETPKYDVFLSSPISSHQSVRKYQTHREKILAVVETLKESCGVDNIFYYGAQFTTYKGFTLPSENLKEVYGILRNCQNYVLIYPERILSSCLIEAGYALGQGITSVYFVRDKKDLPYHLQVAPQVFDFVKIYEYENYQALLNTIKRFGGKMIADKKNN